MDHSSSPPVEEVASKLEQIVKFIEPLIGFARSSGVLEQDITLLDRFELALVILRVLTALSRSRDIID